MCEELHRGGRRAARSRDSAGLRMRGPRATISAGAARRATGSRVTAQCSGALQHGRGAATRGHLGFASAGTDSMYAQDLVGVLTDLRSGNGTPAIRLLAPL